MPLSDDVRRWIKDQTVREDQTLMRPSKALSLVEKNIKGMTAAERVGQIEQIKAGAVVYHEGRHDEKIPDKTVARINKLEARVTRLNNVDAAWEVLKKYGGPTTKETVQAALERSQKERGQERSYSFTQTAVVRPSPSLAMDAASAKEERSMGMGYHGA